MRLLAKFRQGEYVTEPTIAFSPDSRRLITSADTAIVWDVSELRTANPKVLAEGDIDSSWSDLSGDAAKAYEAICRLVEAPEQTIKLLQKNVRPIPKVSEKIAKNLEADVMRHDRALEILEAIGTPDAKVLLEELAGGEPTAKFTKDAKAGVERLERRASRERERPEN